MELLVYKASAGSGKTFTLAVEYIKRLIANPKAYKQILAVTFTNKATTEMKERILQQLYGIWKEDPASEPYLNCIREQCTLEEKEIRERAGIALLNMLHDYSRFRVETIDSFFQSVMRNLARELELAPNLNIELNNDEVLDVAVDQMIEKLTPTSPVLAWLLNYISERIANDKRWNVSKEIKSFGKNIFNEEYIERGHSLRQKMRIPGFMKIYKDALLEKKAAALNKMKDFSDQFDKVLEANNLNANDLKGGSRSMGSYFRKLRKGTINDDDVLNDTVEKALQGAENWTSKTSKQKNLIIELANNALIPILQAAEKVRPEQSITLNSCELSLQHLNELQLLNHIDEEVRSLNHEHNRFLLSDTNVLLHSLVGEGDSSFVFEKLGANIQNVMIDEFQDTSRMQWENFRLLLLEGLSQGADSLIVGDVKQSIYRWRNGDWSILNNLGKDNPEQDSEKHFFTLNSSLINVKTLTTNRRSEANIILFNNCFFQQAVAYLNRIHIEQLQEECLPLKEAYADVAQESPKKVNKGYVKVKFLESDKENPYKEVTLKSLGTEVEQLLAKGVKQNDIAILVRKNKNIPIIAEYFDHELGLTVVSDEAFRLDASKAVLILINALRYLANPEENIARYELEHIEMPAGNKGRDLPIALTHRFKELQIMPLYELLEELYLIFELHTIPHQEAYLFSFFDAVTEYLKDHSSDLNSFLNYWEERLYKKTIPSGELDGIRILSIHKSKGLEFHTVLIPFCDWKLENETNNQLIWCQPMVDPYDALDLVPMNYSSTMGNSIYRNDYLQERLQLWVDNLNLLYVAFTRAACNLILWTSYDGKGTMSELLNNTVPNIPNHIDSTWNEEELTFESGELCPSEEKIEPNDGNQKARINKLIIDAKKLPITFESRRHEVTFKQSNRSADFIAGISEEESQAHFINRGLLLHTVFSAIRTPEDVDDAITRLVFEGVIGTQEMEEEVRELTLRALSFPEVQDWYSGTWELFNECDIIWMENGKFCKRRPDRVMMRNGEIVILDFKFGKPKSTYIKQVQEYMSLLIRMGYSATQMKGYLWYVDEERIEEVNKK